MQKAPSFAKLLVINLVVACAYLISGKLALLLLATPPSSAAAIWPASGIALAAILIAGYRVWPGILLGAFIVQTLSFLDFSNTTKVFSSLQIGLIVAVQGAAIKVQKKRHLRGNLLRSVLSETLIFRVSK